MEGTFDDLLTKLGTGKWNIFRFVALSYVFSLPLYHTLGGAFLAPRVPYTCRPPRHLTTSKTTTLPASGITLLTNTTTQNSCTYLVESSTSGDPREEACTEWDFDNSTFSSTVTSEFGLVCGQQYLQVVYHSLYLLGNMVGAFISGFLSDSYGRKTMITAGTLLFTMVAIGSCWLTNIYLLLASRFLLGTLESFFMHSSYTLVMETLEPKFRSIAGIIITFPLTLGTIAWGGFAYLLRDWRMLQLTVSLTCLLFLPVLLLIDESPRWLLVQGQQAEALRVLQKTARWNKVTLPLDQHLHSLSRQHTTRQAKQERQVNAGCNMALAHRCHLRSLAILFRTPRLRSITFGCYLNFIMVKMVYYGLSLSGGNLTTDPFIYMALTGAMDLPNVIVSPLTARAQRKVLVIVFFLLTGASLLAVAFIPSDIEWLVLTLALIAKITINIACNIVILYASELFPTEVRSRGLGTSSIASGFGIMLAPIINDYLALYTWLPSVVFGAASLVAGLVTFNLPETLNVTLPDTITQLEQQHQKAPDSSLHVVVEAESPVKTLHYNEQHLSSYEE